MEGQLREAVDILRGGGIVAFPTDTVYGLGADSANEEAIRKIYAAKERPLHTALPLLLSSITQIADVARDIPQIAWQLAERFLPGGLTLVLYRLPSISPIIAGGGLGRPITGTSANLSGRPDPLTADQVREQMGASIDLVIDGGRCYGGTASTVIDLTTEPPVILRQGVVSREDIGSVCVVSMKEA